MRLRRYHYLRFSSMLDKGKPDLVGKRVLGDGREAKQHDAKERAADHPAGNGPPFEQRHCRRCRIERGSLRDMGRGSQGRLHYIFGRRIRGGGKPLR